VPLRTFNTSTNSYIYHLVYKKRIIIKKHTSEGSRHAGLEPWSLLSHAGAGSSGAGDAGAGGAGGGAVDTAGPGAALTGAASVASAVSTRQGGLGGVGVVVESIYM
jgi:hypothetical protein